MTSVPLLGHASLDEIFAWRPAGTVRVRDFLAEVAALAGRLPAGNNLLNVCQDRYRFTVGFAAGLISGKTSLQPASQSAETLRQIQAACPDVVCLCDDDFDTLDLPRLDFPLNAAVNPEKVAKIPVVPAEQIAACLFTSGSTGRPTPHTKTWGRLVKNARAEAAALASSPKHTASSAPCQPSTATALNRPYCLRCMAMHRSGRAGRSIRRTSSVR